MRIGNGTTLRGPADPLAVKRKALDFKDLVNFEIAQIVSKVNNKQLPNSIQASFQLQDSKYDGRGTCIFKKAACAKQT